MVTDATAVMARVGSPSVIRMCHELYESLMSCCANPISYDMRTVFPHCIRVSGAFIVWHVFRATHKIIGHTNCYV